MKALPAIVPEHKWTIMTGPNKGKFRVISDPIAVIGRSDDCDIVILDDPKCSRRHAKVEWHEEGPEIQVLSKSNALKVNGEPVERQMLEDGDVIMVGSTELQFHLGTDSRIRVVARSSKITVTPGAQVQPSGPPIDFTPFPAVEYQKVAKPVSRPTHPQRKSGNNKRFIIYAVIGLILLWLITGSTLKKKKELTIRTQEEIDQDIEAARKLEQSAEQMHQSTVSNNFEISHAQENYVKGFRDFRKGQYERALESFQACLALNPQHVLCNRYLHLSERKFSELIEYHMVLGRQYRDQEQYRACRAAFRNVLFMVKDPMSSVYKEAKANFDACNNLVEDRF